MTISSSTSQRLFPVTLQQAVENSPTLGKLTQLARDSSERLEAVELLIPAPLRSAIRAGPIDGPVWCLLVDSSATAAKMRQILPALLNRLRDRGWQITSIRLKVQTAEK